MPHHAMPGAFALLVKMFLNISGDVFLDVVFVHRQAHSPFCLLLEFFRYFRDQHLDLCNEKHEEKQVLNSRFCVCIRAVDPLS